MIDLILAFADRPSAIKAMKAVNFLDAKGDGVSEIEIDPTPIAVMTSPAVLDKDGKETSPATYDSRFFVSVRISGAKALAQLAGKAQAGGDGSPLSIADRTALGAQFKAGSTKADFVRSYTLTIGGVTAELIDETSWPGGPPRVWQ